MNPLKDYMGVPQNPVSGIIQMLDGGANPQVLAEQVLQRNPKARMFLQQVQNQSNGRSPKEMVMQYARQNGISDQQFMALAHRMGLR